MNTYRARIGSQSVELPLVPLRADACIALLMTIDHGVSFIERAGRDLADELRVSYPDVVVSAATLGIPVALEVSRALGLDDYVILQKSRKVHLDDALTQSVTSITSHGEQRLMLDRKRVPAVRGRRVAFVDDVISTGASVEVAMRLLDRAGADVVGIGCLLTEGNDWRERLGGRADLVRSLGSIPLFDGAGQPRT